jgi:hypothetical protein
MMICGRRFRRRPEVRPDDSALRLEGAAGEFVRCGDLNNFTNALEKLDVPMIDRRASHGPKHGVGGARGPMHVKTQLDEAIDHLLDLFFGRPFLHYNNHKFR